MLFKKDEIWREKISNKHIWLGEKINGKIQCFNALVDIDSETILFNKDNYFGDLEPEVIFDNFFKTL